MDGIDLGCRAALGVVLATAAVRKLAAPAPLATLARAIAGLGLPRRLASRPVAAGVIAGELASLALLVAAPLAGELCAAALLAAFTAGLATALVRERRAVCHCFGPAPTPVLPDHLVRNALVLGAAAIGALTRWRSLAAPLATGRPGALVGGVLAGVVGGLAITRWDDLALRWSRRRAPVARRASPHTRRP